MRHPGTSASQNGVDPIHVNVVPPLRNPRRPRPPQQHFSQSQGHCAQRFVPSVCYNSDKQSSMCGSQSTQKPSIRFGGSDDVIKPHIEPEINISPGWFTAGEVSPIDAVLDYFQNLSPSHNDEDFSSPRGQQSCGGKKWHKRAPTEERLTSRNYNKTVNFQQPFQEYDLRICFPQKSKEKPLENYLPSIGINRRPVTANSIPNNDNIPPLNIPLGTSECPGTNRKSSATAPGCELSGAQNGGDEARTCPAASKLGTKELRIPAQLFAENEPRLAKKSSSNFPHPYRSALPMQTRNEGNDKTWRPTMHLPEVLQSSSKVVGKRSSLPLSQTHPDSGLLAPITKHLRGSAISAAPTPESPACVEDVPDNTYQQCANKRSRPVTGISEVNSIINRGRPAVHCKRTSSGSKRPSVTAMPNQYMRIPQSQGRSDEPYTQNQHQRVAKPAKRQSFTISLFKPLPPAPPEIFLAHDPVLRLNAQISNLAHRRLNAEKSIKHMIKLMPQNDFVATERVLHKRQKEKQEVDVLQDEISLIQSQEHELALKLFRAYKRQDIQTAYEPTTFWVRRIA